MSDITEYVNSAVENLPNQFSTHQLIMELAKNHQHQYIESLYQELEKERPFQALHQRIRKFTEENAAQIKEAGKINDMDIFGQQSENTLWEKIS